MYPIYANWNKKKSEMQGGGDISNACKWKLSSYFICWSWNIQVKVYSLQNCRCAQRGNFYLRWNSWNCLPLTSQFQACQSPLRQPSTVATFLIIGTITNTTYCRSYIESYIFNLDKIEGFTPSIPPAVKEVIFTLKISSVFIVNLRDSVNYNNNKIAKIKQLFQWCLKMSVFFIWRRTSWLFSWNKCVEMFLSIQNWMTGSLGCGGAYVCCLSVHHITTAQHCPISNALSLLLKTSNQKIHLIYAFF